MAKTSKPRPSTDWPHRNLPLLLLQAREALLLRFRPILHDHGLTEQQWRVLRALAQSDALEPREIAQRCRISSPSLAGVLARMDELGWIHRERFDHDQRRLSVSLTAKGARTVRAMAPRIEAEYEAIEALVGDEQLTACYAMLDGLLERLSGPEPGALDTDP